VLLHGNGVHLGDFIASGLIDRLARHHRVIAFDRPGFGYSQRPRSHLWTAAAQAGLIRKALARLHARDPIVVGHSWGTLVALELALGHGARVGRLVLVSGYYFPTPRIDALLFALPAIPVLGDAMRYTISALLARLLLSPIVKTVFAPRRVPAVFFEALGKEMLLRPIQLRAAAEESAFMLPGVASLRKRYGRITVPTVIFAGSQDKIVKPDHQAVRLHRSIRGSELRVLPQLGHMAHYGAQDEIVRAVDGMSIAGLELPDRVDA
jgi:pimeloyl-ACP methyl ester carboxylesterase